VGSNPGTLMGGDNTSVKSEAGKVNDCFHLNGTDDYIFVNDLITVLANDTSGAIAFWMFIDTDDGATHTVLGVTNDDGGDLTGIWFHASMVTNVDAFYVTAYVDGIKQFEIHSGLDSLDAHVGSWVYVIINHNGQEITEIYFNNVATVLVWQDTTDKTVWFKDVITDATTKADVATIGVRYLSGAEGNPFDGKLDDLRIFSKALNFNERAFLYNGGSGTELISGSYDTIVFGDDIILTPNDGCLGIATSTFDSTAKDFLAIANGIEPAAHTDNQIYIGSVDSSDATSTLALYLEQAIENIGTFTPSHKIKIKINGTEYWIQLDAV
ncbi:hypothetical protein LCGC14_3047730, partial [marine sediment metagenome]